MSSDKLENIYKLLSEHNFDANKNVPDKFKCGKCRKILIKAYQTRCGCRFCRSCVDEMIKNDNLFCPGNTSDCKIGLLSAVVIDYRANNQISKLIMKCPKETCSYKCELLEMSEHLRICGKESAECPFYKLGCKRRKMSSEKLIEHFQLENYNHNKALIDMIDNIKNEVGELREKEIKHHKKMKIMKMDKLEMENRLKGSQEMIYDEIAKLKSELEKEIMEVRKQSLNKSINQKGIEQGMNQLERNSENILKGTFEMMIENVDKLRSKLFTEIFSEYFYARIRQYKLRLRICPSKELWIHLCVYDDIENQILTFPFTADVTMRIINNHNRELSKSITKYCQIEKPKINSYNQSDPFRFSFSDLTESGILESNCFIIECFVELKSESLVK